MRKELLKGLTEDQIKKVEDCKSSEEILALAKAEGVELSEEQLEAVSGGCKNGPTIKCKSCGAKEEQEYLKSDALGRQQFKCLKCRNTYWI